MARLFQIKNWDDKEPVYDIRTRNENHTEYGKGVQ